mmetsp:Transcript_23867/g.30975  ORF Transcript_23867/g.30975 Transcript_23867/m.30975 type:complete len:152 (-) Transcript_23867:278-733(-)
MPIIVMKIIGVVLIFFVPILKFCKASEYLFEHHLMFADFLMEECGHEIYSVNWDECKCALLKRDVEIDLCRHDEFADLHADGLISTEEEHTCIENCPHIQAAYDCYLIEMHEYFCFDGIPEHLRSKTPSKLGGYATITDSKIHLHLKPELL